MPQYINKGGGTRPLYKEDIQSGDWKAWYAANSKQVSCRLESYHRALRADADAGVRSASLLLGTRGSRMVPEHDVPNGLMLSGVIAA